MSQPISTALDHEINLEKWFNFYRDYNGLVGDYIDMRTNSHIARMQQLAESPKLDSAIEQQSLLARISELRKLLAYSKVQAERFEKIKEQR
ncbi:MAG: hypothetical protein ACHQ1D_00830 [Nitrososphaerales archaeon]